jgi:hypothetical protein
MRGFFSLLPAVALALSACVSTTPLNVADNNPASPKATPGAVDIPSAIAAYKSAADFAAQTTANTEIPPGSAAGKQPDAMPGTPGMHHRGAPRGAGQQ